MTADIARDFDLAVPAGVLVTQVAAEGPAARAGIAPGAIITELAGEPTPTVEAFLGALRRLEPSQSVALIFRPAGQRSARSGTITLAERP